ncbi:hypothetical protein F4777DRAFT_414003 [Nemania sp. FL0916]|nr:hypothetical protein F4777DRAFT_414003 [Nemania sp. FL0916]
MDDPWGSPWASADAPSDSDAPPSSRATTLLSPPPRAFFGNATSPPVQSPWGGRDDDGNQIWGSTARAEGAGSQDEWSPWAESDIQLPRPSPGRSSPSKEQHSLAWPGNAASSPGLRAPSRSRTPSILRHHSPDPWATEWSLANRSDVELPSSARPADDDTPTIDTRQHDESNQTSLSAEESAKERDTSNREPVDASERISDKSILLEQSDAPAPSHEVTDTHRIITSKSGSTAYEVSSRPSSTCTIDSHDRTERQDSPITSIDEDRGARMQPNSQKTSGKVQELVGKYDGLTRAASEEPPAPGRRGTSRTPSREESADRSESQSGDKDDNDNDDDDDGADFGNFEEALAIDSRGSRSPIHGHPELSPISKEEPDDILPKIVNLDGEQAPATIDEAEPVLPHNNVNKFRGITFATNLISVEKLFPDLPDSLRTSSEEDPEIPDHVISDSFTTVSERKAWYRVSRYGSMRKHNSGDDENYHRVSWATSQLHSDTIKIVRRWMEQDSYAGRAILGGTKRTGFFDWDSEAAPVKLDEVFRRKKPATNHSRTTSIPVNSAAAQIKSAHARPYRNSIGSSLPSELHPVSPTAAPVPGFNLNSEAGKSTPAATFSPINQPPNSVLVPEATQGSIHHIQSAPADEDDDDWGDMVSSPQAEVHVEPSASVRDLFQMPTVSHTSTSQPTPVTSAVGKFPEPMKTHPQGSQPKSLDLWLSADMSMLDISEEGTASTKGSISPAGGEFTVPGPGMSQPNNNLPKALGHRSQRSMETYKTSSGNITTSRAAFYEDSPTSAPQKKTTVSRPINSPEHEGQDNLIVQNILQNLPDLTYMLR